MLSGLRIASPSVVKQAPNAMALMKATNLIVEGKPLATEPTAQQYFEPGVNTKLNRRRKPKVDFTLPSDMPKLPLDFVPVNQTPGAKGEEPAEIKVSEGVPADLLDMFVKINAQQKAESDAIEAAKRDGSKDMGTYISKQYQEALSEVRIERKVDEMVRLGYSVEESVKALETVRGEEAVKEARKAPRAVAGSVESAIQAAIPLKAAPLPFVKEIAKEEKKIGEKVAAIGTKGKDIRQLIMAQKKAKAKEEE